MKIAITGDVHLTTREEHPERWGTFENILKRNAEKGIQKLIILGDLFHKDYRNYAGFNELTSKYGNIEFHIIPGNHDPSISQKVLTGSNVHVYVEPQIVQFEDSDSSFLFLPYKSGKTMGEEIAPFKEKLQDDKWTLIGHGDWSGSIRTPNPSEPGIYMPLSRKDIEDCKPTLVLLGHIHKPLDYDDCNLHYVGSPCGLDITETERRRHFVVNTENLRLESVAIDSEIIYFSETLIVYPMENRKKYLENEIDKIKSKWSIKSGEREKVQIRVRVKGYSSDIRELKEVLERGFNDFSFYNDEGPDISEVHVSDDYELLEIIRRVYDKIDQKAWPENDEEPTKSEIVLHSLQTVYNIRT